LKIKFPFQSVNRRDPFIDVLEPDVFVPVVDPLGEEAFIDELELIDVGTLPTTTTPPLSAAKAIDNPIDWSVILNEAKVMLVPLLDPVSFPD